MYLIKFKSSGIVAARFSERAQAKYWLELNNYHPETGDCLDLFELVKG